MDPQPSSSRLSRQVPRGQRARRLSNSLPVDTARHGEGDLRKAMSDKSQFWCAHPSAHTSRGYLAGSKVRPNRRSSHGLGHRGPSASGEHTHITSLRPLAENGAHTITAWRRASPVNVADDHRATSLNSIPRRRSTHGEGSQGYHPYRRRRGPRRGGRPSSRSGSSTSSSSSSSSPSWSASSSSSSASPSSPTPFMCAHGPSSRR